MALIIEKRRMTDISLPPSSPTPNPKRWCTNSEISDPRQTFIIPSTPIEKLRVTFPNMEDKAHSFSIVQFFRTLSLVVARSTRMLQ